MKRIKELFKGVQKSLRWILLIDFIIILVIDLFFKSRYEEGSFPFNLIAFIYTLGISYIASFIFYFVQVHLKELKDKNRVLPSVDKFFNRLVKIEKEIVLDSIAFSDPSRTKASFEDTTKEEFISATKRININDKSSVYQGHNELTWLEYFTCRRNQIEKYIHYIMDFSQYIGEEGISLLADILNDNFLFSVISITNSCVETGLKPSFDLDGLDSFLGEYYELVIRSNDFYSREIQPYHDKKDKSIMRVYFGKRKQIAI